MSNYYKYQFVSPEMLYATVKEELKSYFDTGAVDDLLFPTYVNKCLSKLGKTSYKITETPLYIENFRARLPDNFYGVKEAWMCSEVSLRSYEEPGSFYSQASVSTTIQVSPVVTQCVPESPCCANVGCDGSCMPEFMQTVYKTTNSIPRAYRRQFLLKPGTIVANEQCKFDYTGNLELFGQGALVNTGSFTPYSSDLTSFDIRDNYFTTNLRDGIVHLVFYATDYDVDGNQLVPDNFRIKEYIEAFLKFKVFEILTNQTNDETFNQLQQKLMYYKAAADEAYIMADIEIKKLPSWAIQQRIKKTLNRNQKYELPIGNRYGRRRNG